MSKGKWLDDGYRRKCSACGYSMTATDDEGEWIPANFCPNCGDDKRESLKEPETRRVIPNELKVYYGYLDDPSE